MMAVENKFSETEYSSNNTIEKSTENDLQVLAPMFSM